MTKRPSDSTTTVSPVEAQEQLTSILGLESEPVGVCFLADDAAQAQPLSEWRRLSKHRYCQALMRARRGAAVVLEPEQLSCPAAAAAFGLRSLPEGLVNGKGLVGFGIVQEAATGARMFQQMPRLEPETIDAIALAPLRLAPRTPDVVVVEGTPEQLMWVVLADLNREAGARRRAHTAVLQATCVDSTVVPFLEGGLNFSLGCYGCREATDLAPSEAVIGFPGELLGPLMERLSALAEKAVPRSRAKGVHAALVAAETEAGHADESPFEESEVC